ncbi:MAG: hypothetical protein ACJAVK_001594 [Akkermansiaceae bacterium]
MNAAALSGTGTNLPIAGPHIPVPGIAHSTSVTGGTWTGTWSLSAAAPLIGTTTYNFSALPTSTLPPGTLFLLGDVDDVDDVVDTFDFRA